MFATLSARLLMAFLLMMIMLTSSGCASLPTVAPGLFSAQSTPIIVQGKHGPLSAARSKAMLSALARKSAPTGIFGSHLKLEEALVNSPLTLGNTVVLLEDGPATYRAMLQAILQARHQIDMETYILDDDEVGQRFAAALESKQREGIQVRLMHDSVGTWATPAPFFQAMQAAGVKLVEFNPVNPASARRGWNLNNRDHRKLLIVDGEVAFLGGINISSVYSGSSASRFSKQTARRPGEALPWRDTDIELRGPVVAELQKLFQELWTEQEGALTAPPINITKPLAPGSMNVRAMGTSPTDPFSVIYATLISAIGSAKTSVFITNAYFVPDPQLLTALEAAARRGVDVRLILPGQTDSWLVFHSGRAHYARLLRAGVKLFERQEVILHAKTMVIDGVWSSVGSANLDWRSFLHNYELNVVVLSPDFGLQVQAMFDRDLQRSEPLELERWNQRALRGRFSEWFAMIWSYWL